MSSMLTHPLLKSQRSQADSSEPTGGPASRYFAVRIALGESDAFRLIAARRYSLS